MISIIIPFLNPGSFFGEAIESVFSQTYADWELLLVDDGGDDGSAELAIAWSKAHPSRVVYLQHPDRHNRGISASRNLGLAHASGDYVAFLDADDMWLPHKLERQLQLLESYPTAAMTYGPMRYWFSWTGNEEDSQRDFTSETGFSDTQLVLPGVLPAMYIQNSIRIPTCTAVLLRRKFALAVGGFVDEFTGLHDDQVFYTKIGFRESVLISREGYFFYRQHPSSCCAAAAASGIAPDAQRQFLEWLCSYMLTENIKNAQVSREIEKKMRLLEGVTRLDQRIIRYIKEIFKIALPKRVLEKLKILLYRVS